MKPIKSSSGGRGISEAGSGVKGSSNDAASSCTSSFLFVTESMPSRFDFKDDRISAAFVPGSLLDGDGFVDSHCLRSLSFFNGRR